MCCVLPLAKNIKKHVANYILKEEKDISKNNTTEKSNYIVKGILYYIESGNQSHGSKVNIIKQRLQLHGYNDNSGMK